MQNNANFPQVAEILTQLAECAKQGKSMEDCSDIGDPLDALVDDWSTKDRLELSLAIGKIFEFPASYTNDLIMMASIEETRACILQVIGMPVDQARQFARRTMG